MRTRRTEHPAATFFYNSDITNNYADDDNDDLVRMILKVTLRMTVGKQ